MLQRKIRHVSSVVHEVVRVLAQDSEGSPGARDSHRLLIGLHRGSGDDHFAPEHLGEQVGRLQTRKGHFAVGELRVTHGLERVEYGSAELLPRLVTPLDPAVFEIAYIVYFGIRRFQSSLPSFPLARLSGAVVDEDKVNAERAEAGDKLR